MFDNDRPGAEPSIGEIVEFEVRHIHLPDITEVLHELHDGDVLSGTVVTISDDAREPGSAFVMVRVDRLRRPCVLPVDRVRRIAPKEQP
jgi:hypothetical protein